MIPLYPMLSSMNDGALQKQLAEQFAVNRQQALKVIEAMTPAFSEGLRRQTATPDGAADFMSLLGSGQHAAYGFDVEKAFDPASVRNAQVILDQLFRSAGLLRAITDQVSGETGVPRETVQRMLPVIASAVMGAVTRQTMEIAMAMSDGAPTATGSARTSEPERKAGMMESLYGPGGRMIDEIWSPFLTGATGSAGSTRGDGGLGDMMESFFGPARSTPEKNHTADGIGMVPPGMPKEPRPDIVDRAAEPDEPPAGGGSDTRPASLFASMFAAGEEVSQHQVEAMRKLFDQFADHSSGPR